MATATARAKDLAVIRVTARASPKVKEMVKAMPEQRKALWREQLLKLGLFRQVFEILQRAPDHRIDRDIVLETIVLHMPDEHHDKVFQTFVRWARFGNLFAYDEATESITLQ